MGQKFAIWQAGVQFVLKLNERTLLGPTKMLAS